MRRKYKLIQSKEDIKSEKQLDLLKTQRNSKNEKDEKILKKYNSITSKKRKIISYNSESKKFLCFKKEKINFFDNINDIKKNNDSIEKKKEIEKMVENRNFKFGKKRIEFIKFNKLNLTNKFNTETNTINSDNNENICKDLKYNRIGVIGKYRRRYLNLKNINIKDKEEKEKKLNPEKHVISKLKENKIIENDSQIKGNDFTLENKKIEKRNFFNNNKNESSKLLSLIKKMRKSSTNNISNKKNLKIETNDNNFNENDKEKISYSTAEKIDDNLGFKSISTINSRKKTNSTFNFLIHQAHENSNLSDTFNKIYESYVNMTNKKKRKELIKKCLTTEDNETKSENNESNQNPLSENDNNSLSGISSLMKENENDKLKKSNIIFRALNIPFLKEKDRKLNLRNLLEISPKNKECNTNIDNNSKISEGINVTNKIVNNNTFNTTYNIYKINGIISRRETSSKYKEKIFKISELNHQTVLNSINKNKYFKICINKRDIKNNENKKYKISVNQKVDSFNRKPNENYKEIIINPEKINSNTINIEFLYILEFRIKSLLKRINNYEVCYNECHDWIIFYFNNNIYDLIINTFKNKRNRNNIINKIKLEILCYFLCYDASFVKSFSQAGILLKTIFHLLHNNSLLIINYIINNMNNVDLDSKNSLIINLNKIINMELKINLSLQEIHNENCIIEIIEQNYKQINNYYKMIIDNLYNYSFNSSTNVSQNNYFDEINNNKIFKFPQCLSLDLDKINNNQKLKIISLFFFDAYKLLNNYNILDLKCFYDLFLNKRKIIKVENNDGEKNKRYINYHKNKYRNKNYNILSNIKFNNDSKNCLYPIKLCYKYTLMINLNVLFYNNELINIYNINDVKNKKVLLREGILPFLQEMKQIYELILFSNNSFEYISKILKNFESDEKFFDYILSNNQLNFEKDGSISNIECLNRDLKNIIILDKEQSICKLNKENIIYVRPFYGDVDNDKKVLNKLSEILKIIKYDAEDIDDIRKSIKNYKLDILTTITTNLN